MKKLKLVCYIVGTLFLMSTKCADKEVTAPKGMIEYKITKNGGEYIYRNKAIARRYNDYIQIQSDYPEGITSWFTGINIPIGTTDKLTNKIEKQYTSECELPTAAMPYGKNQDFISSEILYLDGDQNVPGFLVQDQINTGKAIHVFNWPSYEHTEVINDVVVENKQAGVAAYSVTVTNYKKADNTISGTFTATIKVIDENNSVYIVTGSFNEIPIEGEGQAFTPSISGDTNSNGVIDQNELAGDKNGNGVIDNGEIAGDTNGDGTITFPEVAGDLNGDGVTTGGEQTGDSNGDGAINNNEVLGDSNGDGQLNNGEGGGSGSQNQITTYSNITLGAENNTTHGHFFSTTTGTRYDNSNAVSNSDKIDFAYSDQGIKTIGSVLDTIIKTYAYPSLISNFATKLDTRFATTTFSSSDFDAMTTDLSFESISGINEESNINFPNQLQAGDVIIFRTQAGKIGLIRINSIVEDPDVNSMGSINFDVKVQQ